MDLADEVGDEQLQLEKALALSMTEGPNEQENKNDQVEEKKEAGEVVVAEKVEGEKGEEVKVDLD